MIVSLFLKWKQNTEITIVTAYDCIDIALKAKSTDINAYIKSQEI